MRVGGLLRGRGAIAAGILVVVSALVVCLKMGNVPSLSKATPW